MKKVTDFKHSLTILAQQLETLQTDLTQEQTTTRLEELFKPVRQTLADLTDQAKVLAARDSDELAVNHNLIELTRLGSQSVVEARAELQYNEAKYRAVIEQTTDGVMLIQPQTLEIVETNRALRQMFGYGVEELHTLTIYDIAAHPKDRLDYHIRRVLKDNQHVFGEGLYRHKSGDLIPVEVSANLITFHDFSRICVIVRNITERKRAEREIRASQARYKQLLDSVTDYIYMVEIEAGQVVCTTHSPGCEAITGYKPEAFTADPNLWWRIIYNADQAMVLAHAEKIMAGESVEPIEHRLIHQDGSLRWVRNTSVLKRDAEMNLIGYDGLITDVTARKQAELALKESEAKFRILAETTSAAIFIYQDEKNVYVNPAATVITGYGSEELLGMTFWEVLHPDIQDEIKFQGLARQEGQAIEQRYQLKLLRKDGQVCWIDVTLGLIDYQGKTAVLGTAFDITQQKQMEKEQTTLLAAERLQRQQAESLGQIFLTLTSTLDLEHVLDEVLTQTRTLIACSAANIVLLAEDTLLAVRWQGYENFGVAETFTSKEQFLEDYPIDRNVIKTRQPAVVADTQKTPQWVVQPGFEWIRSFAATPINLKNKILGLLRLDSDRPDIFSPTVLETLKPLTDAAAIAIDNAQLYQQTQKELTERVRTEARLNELNQKLLALQYIGAIVASSLDVTSILNTVSWETKGLFDVEGCAIADWKPDVNIISVLIEYNDRPPRTYSIADYPVTRQVLIERRSAQMTLNQIDIDPAEAKFMNQLGIKTLLMLPMESHNRVIGLFEIMDSRTERIFTEDEIALAQYLANYTAVALENARLYAEMQDHIKQQYAVRKATLAIASSLDYETVLNLITKQLGQAVDATSAYLSSYDVSNRQATLLSEYYGPRSCAEERTVRMQPTYTLPNDYNETDPGLIDLPELIHTDDFNLDSERRTRLEQGGAKTALCFPLRVGGRIIGIAEVWESEQRRDFDPNEINLGQGIAQFAGVAIENARLFKQAQQEIKQRKVIEQELRQMSNKNLALLNAIPDMMVYYNREGRIIDYKVVDNNKDLPVGLSIESIHSKKLTEMNLPPDFVGQTLGHIRRTLETGKLQYYEYQLPVNRGLQDFEARVVPSGSDEVLTIIRNITPRKETERALRRSEANLRAIFDNSHQAFILFDREYRILAYNKAARLGLRLITGKRLQEGVIIHHLISPEWVRKLKRIFFSVLVGETVILEEQHTVGKNRRWFEFVYSPVLANDGQILGIFLSILDVDERKRMTEALAEREARLLTEMQSVLMTTRALVTEVNINKLLQLIINQARSLTQARGAAILVLGEDNEWLEVATTDRAWLQMKPSLQLLVPGSLPELAITTQQVQVSNLDRDDERTASIRALLQSVKVNALLCAPLIAQGENLGVLLIWHKRKRAFSNNDGRLMELFADQAALAWHNAQLYARNEELVIRQERHRLARELHDSVTQSLYSIGMAAQASLRLLPGEQNALHEPLEHIHELSQIALTEIREQVFNLRPTALVEKGLIEVITEYCHLLSRKHDLMIIFETNLSEPLFLTHQEHLYYITREALWNIVKHANARQVKVSLAVEGETLSLAISDNGQGFEPTLIYGGMGLNNIKERAKLLQGQITIQSQPGKGTQILIYAPFRPQDLPGS